MIYRPAEPRSLWGFWTIEWNGDFHIFYDEDINADYDVLSWQKTHDHVGHAVSKDLVHWEARPSLCVRGKAGEWNEMVVGNMKTGCIARYEDKFYMFVGAQKDGVQVMGLWISDDLENWEQHSDNPILKPAGPYYLDAPITEGGSVSWRDPGITYCKEDACYHMCISSMLKKTDSSHVLGSVIGHVRSKDLINWEYLPPFETQGLQNRFYQNEEAEIFEANGKYYLIFDGGTTGGMRVNTPYRDDVRGSFYMMSENLDGPYISPKDDFLIGNDMGARCATTGRVISYKGENLFIHFSIGRRPVLGTLKYLRTRQDGTLYLEYMPALEKLETDVICGSVEDIPMAETRDTGKWNCSDGKLSCDVKSGGSVCRVTDDVSDFNLSCTIKGVTADRAGVVVRICKDGDVGVLPRGVGIILDFDKQRIFISDANSYPTTGWYCKEIDICRMPLSREKNYQLRCIARDEHLEVYLDNRWVFTTVIPAPGKSGRIEPGSHFNWSYRWGPEVVSTGPVELMVEHGEAIFSDFRLAAIEPLA